MSNPYYDSDSDLVLVGEVDPREAYQFDTVAVWKSKTTGKLVWDADSGCSCPTPFDNFDPKPLPETWADFERTVNENGADPTDRHALLEQVREMGGAR